jgi:leucyl-tRNA synthetase
MAERLDWKNIESKWQKSWEDEKVFQVEVDKRKKYYITTPYPYMSGLLHIGHIITYIIPEAVSRFKRMQGYNVLFKYGFHCTGTPINAAAQRVAEGEQKQIDTLRQMGIADEDIADFGKPEHWVEYFPKETLKDLKKLGFSIDERYTFITTSLNPPYDAFIRWQFLKLQEKDYVKKGKHPVVWCPKDNSPVGDHARSEGEGETPQEFTLLKFKFDDSFIVAATLRPETVYGQTNMWVGPDIEYVKAKVNNEKWIISRSCAEKLKQQDREVQILEKIKGSELIGKKCTAPGIEREIPILPSHFCDPEKGTGLVTSVPSDAPDDWMGLHDLQANKDECEKYGLDWEETKKIKPIAIISSRDLGDMAAVKICADMGIKTQHEREKLEKAKKIVYKKGFYEGTMNKNCGKYAGLPVEKAKDIVKKELLDKKQAELFYELTGKVVCRCLTESIVKIVSDQWFIEYNDPEWKKITHECLDKMTLWPEKSRKQFEYVIDWLNRWACVRELGLGTSLPWDENWVIESLSDSTLQMAYCTIAKYLQHPEDYGFSTGKLNPEFFDYVFLGKGKVGDIKRSTGIPEDMIRKMRNDFIYWYPFDFRNSAKDLIQNHLAFCLFNHTAIFPEKYWPRAYEVNGRVMINNEKMSKSKGNFFTVREMYEKHGADAVRIAAANAIEGLDDGNYELSFIDTAKRKLQEFHDFAKENYNKGRKEKLSIDRWFASVINECIANTSENLENMLFKSAVQSGFLDMQRHLKWYIRRTNNDFNKELVNWFIEAQIKMLVPFTPHFAEESWEAIGKKPFVSDAEWPGFDAGRINPEADTGESMIEQLLLDINSVLKLAKIDKPKTIRIFLAQQWKYDLLDKLRKTMEKTKDFKEIMKKVMEGSLKQHGTDITKIMPRYIKAGSVPDTLLPEQELKALKDSKKFLEQEYGCEIKIEKADKSKEAKAAQAMPAKPAILVE